MKRKVITNLNIHGTKLIRRYEQITGEKVETGGGITYINHNLISNPEALKKHYECFKKVIENEDLFEIFIFENIEDVPIYDIDGLLQKNAITIDSIDNDTRCMTIQDLSIDVKKALHHYNEPTKVVVYDESTGKEYMMDELIQLDNDKIGFSIFPIKDEKQKEGQTLSSIFMERLNKKKKDRIWLAEKLGMPSPTLYGKFSRDSFNAYEMIKIAKILEIDFDCLKNIIKKIRRKEI